MKRYKDFLTENINIFEGNFAVTKDMVNNGKLIKGKIPRIVNGSFYCEFNKLTTLEGCPEKVNGNFNCSNNRLTSLEFCPKEVGGDFYCYANSITSLEFGPRKVGGTFNCTSNVNNLSIERDFIKSGMFKNNYYTDLLNYMLSNKIDLERVESWPEGFITNNIKTSNKGTRKFNL